MAPHAAAPSPVHFDQAHGCTRGWLRWLHPCSEPPCAEGWAGGGGRGPHTGASGGRGAGRHWGACLTLIFSSFLSFPNPIVILAGSGRTCKYVGFFGGSGWGNGQLLVGPVHKGSSMSPSRQRRHTEHSPAARRHRCGLGTTSGRARQGLLCLQLVPQPGPAPPCRPPSPLGPCMWLPCPTLCPCVPSPQEPVQREEDAHSCEAQ